MQSSFVTLVSFELANQAACLPEVDMWCEKHLYQRTKIIVAIMSERKVGFNVEAETWCSLITSHLATKLHVTRSDGDN